MTPYEEELLTGYLTHLNVLGEDGGLRRLREVVPTGPICQRPRRTADR